MAKRKNGEGSWGVKKIKGVEYKYFRKQYEGMNNPKYFYGKTEKEIKSKIKEFENQYEILTPVENEKTTFGEYVLNWLNNVKRLEIKRRTFDGYEDSVKNQILNYHKYDIAGKQMGSINQDMFQEYYNSLSKKYSRAAIQKNYTIVNQCLKYAKKKKVIRDNYVEDITLPSEDNVAVKKKEIPFLPEDDMDKLYLESKRIHEEVIQIFNKLNKDSIE